MQERPWPVFTPVADHALLVNFGEVIDDATSEAVIALDRALSASPPVGLLECVPALVNLLVDFDPLMTDHEQIRAAVLNLLRTPPAGQDAGTSREVEICYECDFSPDLPTVATLAGLSVDEVINSHLRGEYQVRMYGFAPGYAYLSGVAPEIQVPRKPSAVRDIPAGSVLIAGPQCLVTTLAMPTGWSIIGRSPTRVLTGNENAPFLFDVGDRVRFRRIDLARYQAQRAKDKHA